MEEFVEELIWGRGKKKDPLHLSKFLSERGSGKMKSFPHIVSPIFSPIFSPTYFLGVRRLLLLLLFSFLIYKKKKYIYKPKRRRAENIWGKNMGEAFTFITLYI